MLKSRSTVETQKASRYLKALCNHFERKVTAEYSEDRGVVQFSIGDCEMQATDTALMIHVQAENDENFQQMKVVMADHLIRFAANEILVVNWADES